MVKSNPKFSPGGYSVWSVKRTLRESINVARFSPWSAIAWMDEAKDRISLENPLFDEFDAAANRINALWRSYERMHWYDPKDFWRRGKVVMPAQRIKTFDEVSTSDTVKSIQDLFKI
jgi:hypothetical protein